MTEAELIFTALAELSTRAIEESDQATGMPKNKLVAKKGDGIAKKARMELEQKTGKPVASGSSFSPPVKKGLAKGKKKWIALSDRLPCAYHPVFLDSSSKISVVGGSSPTEFGCRAIGNRWLPVVLGARKRLQTVTAWIWTYDEPATACQQLDGQLLTSCNQLVW